MPSFTDALPGRVAVGGLKRLLAVGLVLCLGTVAAQGERGLKSEGPAAGADVEMGRFYLLTIGIDQYLHWPKLRTAVHDAKAVEKALTSDYAFDFAVRLHDARATRRNIIKALRMLTEKMAQEDSLLVYYAGHGHLDKLTDSGSWIPVDADKEDDSTWLSNARIKTYVRAMKARHVLLISDSCFAGDFFRGTRGKPPEITDNYVRAAFTKRSRQALTSGGLEPVTDDGFEGHSVFTYFLLKALRENRSPYLLPTHISSRIQGGVSANASQQVLLGQLDQTGGEVGGEFVLCRKGVGRDLDALIRRKQEQISRLQKLQDEAREKEEREQEALTQREAELKELDARIAQLRNTMDRDVPGEGALDQLLASVQRREEQARELERLRSETERERLKREAEIRRIRDEESRKQRTAFQADLDKYEAIRDSLHSSEVVRDKAWDALCAKWHIEMAERHTALAWDDERGRVVRRILAGDRKVLDLGKGVKMVLVGIPAGSLELRAPGQTPPGRRRASSGFWMAQTEVTQEQYEALMGRNPSRWKDAGKPVENVSWRDAKAFAAALHSACLTAFDPGTRVRLPSELEWEFACRAGSKAADTGNGADLQLAASAWFRGNSQGSTQLVAHKAANGFGLHDMLGNVSEWCEDWYTREDSDATRKYRSRRGGSWMRYADHCRATFRDGAEPEFADCFIGIRIVAAPQ